MTTRYSHGHWCRLLVRFYDRNDLDQPLEVEDNSCDENPCSTLALHSLKRSLKDVVNRWRLECEHLTAEFTHCSDYLHSGLIHQQEVLNENDICNRCSRLNRHSQRYIDD